MDNFLPKDYEIPQKSARYMKFEGGENRFRILATPLLGWKWWETGENDSQKPVRICMEAEIPESVDKDEVKHFWAVPVWSYKEERVQILELTQKVIQKAIKSLVDDPDWGNPINYDLVVVKSGQKLDTEYQINPKPAKPLDPGIKQLFADMKLDLEALYRGEDPFEVSSDKAESTTAEPTTSESTTKESAAKTEK